MKIAEKGLKIRAVLRIVDLNMVRMRLMALRSITRAIKNDTRTWGHLGESPLSNQLLQHYLGGTRSQLTAAERGRIS